MPGARSTEDDIQQIRANKRFQNQHQRDEDRNRANETSSIMEDEFLSDQEDEDEGNEEG